MNLHGTIGEGVKPTFNKGLIEDFPMLLGNYNTMWTTVTKTTLIIIDALSHNHSLVSEIKNIEIALKEWNKSNLSHIFS